MKKRFTIITTILTSAAFLPLHTVTAASLTLKGSELTAARGETVTYQIMLQDNPGIDEICFAFDYDPALKPVLSSDNETLKFSTDYPGLNHIHWSRNTAQIAYGIVTMDEFSTDGVLASFQFTVPQNAEPGDVYEFAFLKDTQIAGYCGNEIAPVEMNGSITVSEGLPAGFGDANTDGTLTIADAILLARVLAEDITVSMQPQGRINADVDGIDGLSPDDLTIILQLIAGIEQE